MGDLVVANHGTHFIDWAIQEGLFFSRQLRSLDIVQLFPVRLAFKQFGFPPNCSGLEGFFLGL
ncbi:Uncharacterised protein [Vibrio cholerae]|uniref:Uncharacterized protein n=1 Tax=Vibrio cholerae TaxID=666 RepID=A0A655P3J3_VIBCL|nr:Uncharacterised protein [Vibrio cholerae]CSA21773.1 Uncharacterised protein [Vibrio cholerae]